MGSPHANGHSARLAASSRDVVVHQARSCSQSRSKDRRPWAARAAIELPAGPIVAAPADIQRRSGVAPGPAGWQQRLVAVCRRVLQHLGDFPKPESQPTKGLDPVQPLHVRGAVQADPKPPFTHHTIISPDVASGARPSWRCVGNLTGFGQQHRLIVSFPALSASHHAVDFSQPGSLDPGSNLIRRVEIALELDLMTELTVRRGNVARAFTGLEPDEQATGRAKNPSGLREDARLAVSTMLEDRSTPCTRHPRSVRYRLIRPVPHGVEDPRVVTCRHCLGERVDHG